MKVKKWINKTVKHPNGVCEAATIIWLKKIKDNGVAIANEIAASECDELQTHCENGSFTWAIDLETYVAPRSFQALDGNTLKDNGTDKDSIEAGVINHLKDLGDFIYVSASTSGHDGHAMALYRDASKIYYFDPNNAIYEVDINDIDFNALKNQIKMNCSLWKDVVTRPGKI